MTWEGWGVLVALVVAVANTAWNAWTWGQTRKPKGAQLTARLIPGDDGIVRHLVITNLGEDPATTVMLGVDDEHVSVRGLETLDGLELRAREEHRLQATVGFGLRSTPTAVIAWRDGLGHHERRIPLTLP